MKCTYTIDLCCSQSIKTQMVVFSVNTVMAVSPNDDSVSSDGSVCTVEECYNLQYLFQRGTLQDMINGY